MVVDWYEIIHNSVQLQCTPAVTTPYITTLLSHRSQSPQFAVIAIYINTISKVLASHCGTTISHRGKTNDFSESLVNLDANLYWISYQAYYFASTQSAHTLQPGKSCRKLRKSGEAQYFFNKGS